MFEQATAASKPDAALRPEGREGRIDDTLLCRASDTLRDVRIANVGLDSKMFIGGLNWETTDRTPSCPVPRKVNLPLTRYQSPCAITSRSSARSSKAR